MIIHKRLAAIAAILITVALAQAARGIREQPGSRTYEFTGE
ncbi:hypothetical protein [Paenibacillus sp. HW567]|nr:hypothetical protein [Paenibacillus sp. HW567]